MTAAIGDVVWYQDAKWVVAGLSGSPRPVPMARLLRPSRDGNWAGASTYSDLLPVLSSPTFSLGERVRVDGLPGEIIAAAPDEHVGETMWLVRLDPYGRPLKGGGHIRHSNNICRVPAWKLTLENHLNA